MSAYQPPYTITPEILNRVAAISETLGRLTVLTDQARALRLRRINRIRTIHGSLAIEGNTLSEAQITAILEGKRIIAPPREVQEVKPDLCESGRVLPGYSGKHSKDRFLSVHRLHAADDSGFGDQHSPPSQPSSHPSSRRPAGRDPQRDGPRGTAIHLGAFGSQILPRALPQTSTGRRPD